VEEPADHQSLSANHRIYLTFDDGPHPDRTPRILDQLAANHALATFFVIGRRARRWPNVLRRIVEAGHALGTHTWSHWSARKAAAADYVADAVRARTEVEQIVGHSCPLFRPPYGELTLGTLIGLLKSGFRIVQWSCDTKDFLAASTAELTDHCTRHKPQSGDIVLMHDDRSVTSYCIDSICRAWAQPTEFRAIRGSGSQSTAQAAEAVTTEVANTTATVIFEKRLTGRMGSRLADSSSLENSLTN
jgi:peptidoglycan/xylan/chitin deacetylase (PgdA/CDA1 family)